MESQLNRELSKLKIGQFEKLYTGLPSDNCYCDSHIVNGGRYMVLHEEKNANPSDPTGFLLNYMHTLYLLPTPKF